MVCVCSMSSKCHRVPSNPNHASLVNSFSIPGVRYPEGGREGIKPVCSITLMNGYLTHYCWQLFYSWITPIKSITETECMRIIKFQDLETMWQQPPTPIRWVLLKETSLHIRKLAWGWESLACFGASCLYKLVLLPKPHREWGPLSPEGLFITKQQQIVAWKGE